eukprot:6581609-Prymnesium_polylepis.1
MDLLASLRSGDGLRAIQRDCTHLGTTLLAAGSRLLAFEEDKGAADMGGAGASGLVALEQRQQHAQQQQAARQPLDLDKLDPSLYGIGIEVVEKLNPRYLEKAGCACERMQQAGLPVDVIQEVLLATFSGFGGSVAGHHSEQAMGHIFSIFDSSGDGLLDEDEFMAIVPLLGEVVPPRSRAALFAAVDAN